ncbi:MAG: hypothetical protein CTR53_05400 [Ferrovibrio sp.]|nr:MAG: hypothetical protein CTR53_05400 [Ferrovibrio sp.]
MKFQAVRPDRAGHSQCTVAGYIGEQRYPGHTGQPAHLLPCLDRHLELPVPIIILVVGLRDVVRIHNLELHGIGTSLRRGLDI